MFYVEFNNAGDNYSWFPHTGNNTEFNQEYGYSYPDTSNPLLPFKTYDEAELYIRRRVDWMRKNINKEITMKNYRIVRKEETAIVSPW